MEHKMVTIPFDLETAKRIREGKISGRIVTEKGRDRAEIVYEDDLCYTYPVLVVIHSIPVSTGWFSSTGEAPSGLNNLLLEVPEYTTFKTEEYLKRFFGIEEKPKYDFKPFDKVLVKYYEDDNWEGNLFIRTITDDQDGKTKYECLNGVVFVHCIPFEGNECLLGITENPEKK